MLYRVVAEPRAFSSPFKGEAGRGMVFTTSRNVGVIGPSNTIPTQPSP